MFGLRNYQLYVDDMERIGLDMRGYAISMARTLALLHWEVRCDANDVEFVLGSARAHSRRAVDLWLIDFNRVRAITMDERGIDLAAEAFMVNDRYYRRPLCEDATRQKLWSVFEEVYIEASARLEKLHEAEGKTVDWQGLPKAFIQAVVEAQEKLVQGKTEAVDRTQSAPD